MTGGWRSSVNADAVYDKLKAIRNRLDGTMNAIGGTIHGRSKPTVVDMGTSSSQVDTAGNPVNKNQGAPVSPSHIMHVALKPIERPELTKDTNNNVPQRVAIVPPMRQQPVLVTAEVAQTQQDQDDSDNESDFQYVGDLSRCPPDGAITNRATTLSSWHELDDSFDMSDNDTVEDNPDIHSTGVPPPLNPDLHSTGVPPPLNLNTLPPSNQGVVNTAFMSSVPDIARRKPALPPKSKPQIEMAVHIDTDSKLPPGRIAMKPVPPPKPVR